MGRTWPTVMTASRLSAHVNFTFCHPLDGGKVQAWSWHTFENCQSINAHQEAVTSIQVGGSPTSHDMLSTLRMLKLFFHVQSIFIQHSSWHRNTPMFLALQKLSKVVLELLITDLWKGLSSGNQTAIFLHSYPHTSFPCLLLSNGNQRYLLRCKLWSLANFREHTEHILSKKAFYGYWNPELHMHIFFQFAIIKICLKH